MSENLERKGGGANSNVVGIPPIEIKKTYLPKSGSALAPILHPGSYGPVLDTSSCICFAAAGLPQNPIKAASIR